MKKVEFCALSEHTGAEILGVDLSTELDEGTVRQIVNIWQQFAVLLFRRQWLSEDDMIRFAKRFGELEVMLRQDIASPYHKEVAYISNLYYEDGKNLGALGADELGWHTDQTYMRQPSTGAMLYAIEVPEEGGNTLFANQYYAYNDLPGNIKKIIDGRYGIFSYEYRMRNYRKEVDKIGAEVVRKRDANSKQRGETAEARHPLVLSHPVTGRRALYADCATMSCIDGMATQESDELIDTLKQAAVEANTAIYEHKWQPGDVLLWDNGCVMHRRTPFQMKHPRLMKRITMFMPGDKYCRPY